MNYKFPLVNLIARGHIPVENPVSTMKFLESLSNDTAERLYEQVYFIDDPKKCARFLDAIQEEVDLVTEKRILPSDEAFKEQRDNFFVIKEDSQQSESDNPAVVAAKILKMIKRGVPIGIIMTVLLKYDAETRNKIISNISLISQDTANLLKKSWATNWILRGGRSAKRMASSILTGKNQLNTKDKKLLKGLGIGTVAGIGIIAMLLGINTVYKRYFSKEAKECSGMEGKSRTLCMAKSRLLAAKEAQKQAEKALSQCDSTKNPEDCRFKMRVEIRSWMKKQRKEQELIAKLTKIKSQAFDQPKKKPNPFE